MGQKLVRFNFDRWQGDKKMAEGIGVHAPNLMAGFILADMMNGEGLRLTFRDIKPCESQCQICGE